MRRRDWRTARVHTHHATAAASRSMAPRRSCNMAVSVVLLCVAAAALVCQEASGFMIRNKLLGKCLQAQVGRPHGRVSTVDCSPNTPMQEWRWHAGSQALVNDRAGQCLTAPAEQYEGVRLQPCVEVPQGMSWKITMLVLSSLALVLGTVILIFNVYSNSRKKVVCVLRSYAPREEVSASGSPAPSERAPLTKHAMRLPHSSPSLRGEILIEWKDGTVTPLYEG
ncbi:unnamed protein product [Merluccius merluccius]